MEKTTRRNLLKAAAVGGVTATGLGACRWTASAAAQKPGKGDEHAHDNRPNSGKRAHVGGGVRSMGGGSKRYAGDRSIAACLVRLPLPTATCTNTCHSKLRSMPAARCRSSISGLHQIVIYANRDLADVQAAAARARFPGIPLPGDLPPPAPPCLPGLVNLRDRSRRIEASTRASCIYMSPGPGGTLSPNLILDRIESVNFFEPGRYLVVCGVRPHFDEGMHGYVNVKA